MNLAARSQRTLIRYSPVLLVVSLAAHADTLHNIGGGAHQHHDSRWIFPEQIGEFTRIGAPQDVDGTTDVVAYYTRSTPSGKTSAIVDVYPPTSAAPHARLDDALRSLRDESGPDASVLREGELALTSKLGLTAKKTATRPDVKSPRELYFVDTGAWIVKIRVTLDAGDESSLKAADEFVMNQQWDSIAVTASECTGPACKGKTR